MRAVPAASLGAQKVSMAAVDQDVNDFNDGHKKADGVSASLQQATFDQDLYGNGTDRFSGYERSIGVAEADDGMDEREQAIRR